MNTHQHLHRFKVLPLAVSVAALFSNHAQAQQAPVPTPSVQGELAAIDVVGRTESGTYQSTEADGTKSNLPLRELPQSVRIMTRQAMDDLGATRLDDLLDYVGGVSRQNNFGGLWDNVAIRGLPGNENTGMATLFNGFSANRGFNAPRDLAGVERVEFLKGPAAALYGSSEPGGTLNIVTKKPQFKAAHSAEAYLGSYGLKRGAFDTTGPVGENFAYRLNIAVEDKNSFRDKVSTERRVLAPAFTWKLGQDTQIEYTGEMLRQTAPLDRGVVAVSNQLGAVPLTRFLGEPADGEITIRNNTHQIAMLHAWNADWSSKIALSLRDTTLNGFSTEPTALQADNATLRRQRRFRDYTSEDTALQAELQGVVRMGKVEHELLFGLETYRFNFDQVMRRINPSNAAPYAINILNPVYGQEQPTPLANTSTLEKQSNTAFYLQDAVKLNEQWRLVAGVRKDNYEQSLVNRLTNVTTKQSPGPTSQRIGVSWLPTAQWTVYANAGTSFRPNVGTNALAQPFDAESSRAVELGAKWESADKRLGATLAAFNINKRNVVTADPINAGSSIAAGEIRSKGLEFDLSGQVTNQWRVNASMVVNDVVVSKDNSLQVGGRLLNVPRVNASVLAVYENALSGGQRYGVGGGVTHTGVRLGEARTQAQANAGTPAFDLPSYTTAKLVGYLRINPTFRVTLDIDNLFNTAYYSSSYSRVWVTPGTTRTITLGVQARF